MNVEQAITHLRYRNVTNKERFTEAIDVLENEINRQKAEIERLHEVINGFEEQSHKELLKFVALSEKYTDAKAEIKKLQSEIERLQSEKAKLHKLIPKMIKEAKSEAIKEFAERFKNLTASYWLDNINKGHIDNLAKEMVGE